MSVPGHRRWSEHPASRPPKDVPALAEADFKDRALTLCAVMDRSARGRTVVLIGLPYNEAFRAYNAVMVANTHVMTVSQNGQVSIPADTRARWKARQVIVVDLGDRVVMRPLGDDMVGALEGKYRGRGPSTDRARKQARAADALRDGPR